MTSRKISRREAIATGLAGAAASAARSARAATAPGAELKKPPPQKETPPRPDVESAP